MRSVARSKPARRQACVIVGSVREHPGRDAPSTGTPGACPLPREQSPSRQIARRRSPAGSYRWTKRCRPGSRAAPLPRSASDRRKGRRARDVESRGVKLMNSGRPRARLERHRDAASPVAIADWSFRGTRARPARRHQRPRGGDVLHAFSRSRNVAPVETALAVSSAIARHRGNLNWGCAATMSPDLTIERPWHRGMQHTPHAMCRLAAQVHCARRDRMRRPTRSTRERSADRPGRARQRRRRRRDRRRQR